MLPRLILALVLALLAFLPTAARTLDTEYAYVLRLRIKTMTAGWVQLFGDIGAGVSEQRSSATPLASGDDFHEYRLSLPAGRYVALRLDPGMHAGRYEIADVAILDAAGKVVVTIPLTSLIPIQPLSTVSRSDSVLIVETGSHDPQLIYSPEDAFWLQPPTADVPGLVRRLLLQTLVALGVVWLMELVFVHVARTLSRRLVAWATSASAHPWITVAIVALVSTLLSSYPTLFFGRSLVSPNNGPVPMLYGQPPFVAESDDDVVENIRTSDVGATMWAFVPYSHVQRMAIAEGELPLWNRYNSTGVPLWGQGQSFMLDPLHWIALLGPDPAPGWDLKFAAHRFVAAWGVGVAALVAVGATAPASIAAATSAFLGFHIFRLNHPAVFVLTYAPWILAGWFLLAKAITPRACARGATLVAIASSLLVAASPPKEASLALLVAWSAGGLAMLFAGRAERVWRYRVGAAAIAIVSTVLLTSPHWVIFLDTLRNSVTFYDAPGVRFAGPELTLSMVLGSLAPDPLGPGLDTLSSALVVAALLSPGLLLAHRSILACVVAAVAAVAIAYGAIPADFILRLPLVANIHRLDLTLLTAAVAPLSIVAALGAQAIFRASRTGLAVLTAGIAGGGALMFGEIGGANAMEKMEGWLVLVALVGAVLMPASLRTATASFPRVLPIISATALVILLLSPGGQHVETGTSSLDRALLQPRLRVPLAGRSPVVNDIDRARSEPSRVLGLGSNLFPGSPALFGFEGIEGPDALMSPNLRELFEASGAPLVTGWKRVFGGADIERMSAALDVLNVEFVVGSSELPAGDHGVPTSGPDLLHAVRRPSAWPRAFFVDRVGRYENAPELLAQARHAARPMAAIQNRDADAAALVQGSMPGSGEVVVADRYTLTTNTTTFRVRAPRAGVAVLSESYMADDFIATLNGQRVPYFRVNHAFKGVVIPAAGDWFVRFEYRPRYWYAALGAAALGALMLFGLGIAAVGSLRHSESPAALASS